MFIKVVAACEVVGGAVVLAKTVPVLVQVLNLRVSFPPGALLTAGYFQALLVTSVVAGLLLWRMHRLGPPLSVAVQALLVPNFALPGLVYHIDLGLIYAVMVEPNSLYVIVLAHIGQFESSLGPPSGSGRMHIGVNLVALGMLVYLLRAMAHERRLLRLGARERAARTLAERSVPMGTQLGRLAWQALAVLAVLIALPFVGYLLNRFA